MGKSHDRSHVREEEEVLKSEYMGYDVENTYWLETKKKFKVYICDKCHKRLKLRSNVMATLFLFEIVLTALAVAGIVAENIFDSALLDDVTTYAAGIAFACAGIHVLFWLLWKIAGPSRVHVKYERAGKCNALAPINADSAVPGQEPARQ